MKCEEITRLGQFLHK